MSDVPSYQRFFAELKRRHVFRVMAMYGAVGFVILQVADIAFPLLGLPEWTITFILVFTLLGFPIAILLAWAFEVSPDGVKRTEEAETGEISELVAEAPAMRWTPGILALVGMVALAGGAWWVGRTTAPQGGPTESGVPHAGAQAIEAGSNQAVLQLAYADLSEDNRPSIAVLPFVNMSADEEQQYFADGMTEELLNALAKIRELRVAGRTSSFAYRGQERDLREIGDELGVRYLVEGSVRKQGDRIRITAQLVNADDAFHLWSETYDRTLEDVFAVQTEIAESIADALEVSLGLEAEEALVTPTSDLDAYDLYLAAQARLRQRGEGVDEAVRLYSAAVARDSGWAPAWAGLAQAEALVPYYSGTPGTSRDSTLWRSSLEKAERAALRALALDPSNASAEVALANVTRDRKEWRDSETHYLQALQIDPDNVEAHQQYAELLASIGRQYEAVRSARRALELDPTSAIRAFVLGYILTDNGGDAAAIVPLQRATEIDPELMRAQWALVIGWLRLGEFERARAVARTGMLPRIVAEEGLDTQQAGELDQKLSAFIEAVQNRDGAALEALSSPEAASPWTLALIGDMDRALAALARLVETYPGYGATWQTSLWSPDWDGVRQDPRFQEILRQMELEEFEPVRAAPGS